MEPTNDSSPSRKKRRINSNNNDSGIDEPTTATNALDKEIEQFIPLVKDILEGEDSIQFITTERPLIQF